MGVVEEAIAQLLVVVHYTVDRLKAHFDSGDCTMHLDREGILDVDYCSFHHGHVRCHGSRSRDPRSR